MILPDGIAFIWCSKLIVRQPEAIRLDQSAGFGFPEIWLVRTKGAYSPRRTRRAKTTPVTDFENTSAP